VPRALTSYLMGSDKTSQEVLAVNKLWNDPRWATSVFMVAFVAFIISLGFTTIGSRDPGGLFFGAAVVMVLALGSGILVHRLG